LIINLPCKLISFVFIRNNVSTWSQHFGSGAQQVLLHLHSCYNPIDLLFKKFEVIQYALICQLLSQNYCHCHHFHCHQAFLVLAIAANLATCVVLHYPYPWRLPKY
jgi:hypothetical protein